MNEYYKRIDENDLKGNYTDGSVLLHTDMNKIEILTRDGINANYEDIQKIEDGSITVENANSALNAENASQLDGATLSKSSVETLQNSDVKVPTSKQVKDYVDSIEITTDYEDLDNLPSINGVQLIGNKTSEQLGISIPIYYFDGQNTPANVAMFNEICDKYDNGESFVLIGKVLVENSYIDDEGHYVSGALQAVVPFSVKDYTEYEQEGITYKSFMSDAVATFRGFATVSIVLTGTWGNFTAVEPLTWSYTEGPIAQKNTISLAPVMPDPTELGNKYLGQMLQYVGQTNANYTFGYIYQCVSDGEETPTYSWQRVDVQPSGGSSSISKVEIATTGSSGTIQSSDLTKLLDNTLNTVIVNSGDVYVLYNKGVNFYTYLSINAQSTTSLSYKAIYVNVSPDAVNYGTFTKETITPSVPLATSSAVGGVKMRYDSTTGTLYIRNDGTDA